MGVVKITSVYMLMEMLILISLYMKTCSIALLLVFPNLVTYYGDHRNFCRDAPLRRPGKLGDGLTSFSSTGIVRPQMAGQTITGHAAPKECSQSNSLAVENGEAGYFIQDMHCTTRAEIRG